MAAAGRAVDGGRPADRCRRADARRSSPTADEERIVGHLGPDLCGAEPPDLDEVTARLQREPDVPLAGALLDQRNVAGFGNLYAIELPFIVGVSPNQPVGSVDGLGGLVAFGTALIRTNAARGPQNTTGRRLNGRRPLDLRPARSSRARCAEPGSTAGTTATARGSACRRGARRASRWRRGAPSTSSGPTGCWRSTRPARSRRYPSSHQSSPGRASHVRAAVRSMSALGPKRSTITASSSSSVRITSSPVAGERRTPPALPAEPLVERPSAGGERAELEVAGEQLTDRLHRHRADARALHRAVTSRPPRRSRTRNVAVGDVQAPRDHRGVRHEIAIVGGDEHVPPPERVIPVLVREVAFECLVHQRAHGDKSRRPEFRCGEHTHVATRSFWRGGSRIRERRAQMVCETSAPRWRSDALAPPMPSVPWTVPCAWLHSPHCCATNRR